MKQEQAIQMLRQTPLFGHLAEEQLDRVLEEGETIRLAKGEELYSEGDASDEVYLLFAGCMQAYVAEPNGKKYVLQISMPGDMLGMESFVDGGIRNSSAVADEDSMLLRFSRGMLCRLFDSEDGLPGCHIVRGSIMRYLVSLVRHMTMLARNLALLDVYGRVRILINQMLVEQDGMLILRKQLTQQEIADQIGSSREMVARILKELIYGHYIRMENRRIVVLKMLPENF
ncbi:Crp/Fnr family transcriptional regulator [Chromobacterium amazonense]|uniref:Crp/Fnr family transcriptional regulator n=1 Tax=Chromobacterium amazonense TaxID=1382803 RepID=A0ABU8V274_9NEIS|nr:Crp/Fnr family transcriptional regulator [Chromobacterium amazonense]KIA81547.1 Crp/Fnr family transcriptional regulator [Chromobacterium piscinae]MDE1711398.1 Crp/Fnr family transcriptional regulator [Chromobacterium amazonense]MDQ4541977.1 Crp/Fnr family transcriptional regulator [Chromobacterium amazonense]